MSHDLDLILTLTGGLAAALLFGLLSQYLRLSPIVGYLVAGIAVGPFTPGFVAHREIAGQFAEVGVVLLMFGVGLHFHPRELLAVKRVAIPGAVVQIAIATALGAWLGHLFGWKLTSGVVFGLAISVASTVVLLRVLADNDALHTAAGHVAVGWLLVEDLFTVVALVVLPALTGQAASKGDTIGAFASVGISLAKVAALVLLMLSAGQRLVPKVLARVAKSGSRELFTLSVLVVALGIAVAAVKVFGVSMALGAFLAGMVVGQSEFSTRAASEALPMRDAFAVLFFVSVGMLLDPSQIWPNLGLILATLAVVLLGKPLGAILVVVALRHPPGTAATVAIALAQIGEFSFILATVGQDLGLLPEAAAQAVVAASIVSITVNPLLYRLVDPLTRLLPLSQQKFVMAGRAPSTSPAHRVLVVGHGPVGRTLVGLLRENHLDATVIELNHDTAQRLQSEKTHVVYGDASQREVLEQAGIRDAGTLVFAASGDPNPVVRQAMALNPDLLVMTRTNYVSEISELRRAGAGVVVSSELEVAMAMTEHVLRKVGATPEQLDRARDRVRRELED